MTSYYEELGDWIQIGKQRVRHLPRGLFIEMHGEYELAEAQIIYPMLAVLWQERSDTFVLVDCHDVSGMSADVRRYAVKFAREHAIQGDTIMIGGGLFITTFIKMVMAAIKLVSGQHPRIHFVKSETEAWDLTKKLRAPDDFAKTK